MKFGFIFPGYGNQFVGMGKEFYDHSRAMQEYFEEAASCLDKNFVKLCFASSDAELAQLENAYISLFLVSVSIAAILKEQGVEPSLVAGRDSGEYAALMATGGITLPDAVYLLRKYASLYEEQLKEHRFEALRVKNAPTEALKKLCLSCSHDGNAPTVAVNETDNQSMVTGTLESIACVKEALQDKHMGPIQELPVGSGLHSPLMDEIVKTMKMYLEKVDFKEPQVPFIASVTGQALKEGDAIRAAVMQQIHAPLQWKKVMEAFAFCDVIIITGSDETTKKLLETVYPEKQVVSIINPEQLNALLSSLGKPLFEWYEDGSDDL